MGRPPLAKSKRRNKPIHVMCLNSERKELREAAKAENTKVSVYVREAGLEKARLRRLQQGDR